MKVWRIIYADGHKGQWRTWESVLELIYNERLWPAQVEHLDYVFGPST